MSCNLVVSVKIMTRIKDIMANIISIDNEKTVLLVQEFANYAPTALE